MLTLRAETPGHPRHVQRVDASPHGVRVTSERTGSVLLYQRTPRRFWLVDGAAAGYRELNETVYAALKGRLAASHRLMEVQLSHLPASEREALRHGPEEPDPDLGGGIVTSQVTRYVKHGRPTAVAGIACQPYRGSREGRLVAELCIAAAPLPGADAGTASVLAALALFADDLRMSTSLWMPWFGSESGTGATAGDGAPPGLPVRQVLYARDGKVRSRLVLVSLSDAPLADPDFQLPSGLRRL